MKRIGRTQSGRRSMGLLLVFALCCTIFFTPVRGEGAFTYGITRLSGTVNLRAGAAQSSRRLAVLQPGTWFTLLGEVGAWYQIQTAAGQTGYVSKNLSQLPQDQMVQLGVVNNPGASAFLNLRQVPSLQGKVLGIYYNGTPALVLGSSDGWAMVQVGGITGYFREEFLQMYPAIGSGDVATVVSPNQTPVNLRMGPSKDTQVLTQYPGGTYVMILQRGAGWHRVSVNGIVGFMDAAFLKNGVLPPRSADSSAPSAAKAYATVKNPRPHQVLNLRERPDMSGAILARLPSGTRLQMVEQGTDWCRVSQGDLVGYVMTPYLMLTNLPKDPIKTITHPRKSYVNLRSQPGVRSGTVMLRVSHGSRVVVRTPGDQWVLVQYQGVTGYVAKEFLK